MDGSYGVQVAIYALAALRAGAAQVEIAYAFLDRLELDRRPGASPRPMRTGWTPSCATPSSPIRAGRFPARPGPQCRDCPALDLLCAGGAGVGLVNARQVRAVEILDRLSAEHPDAHIALV